ncbi:MAG: chemotaxis protein CheX [Bdellovibrionota bacterium]
MDIELLRGSFSEFSVYVQAGYTLIKAVEILDRDSFNALVRKINSIDAINPQHYFFDFGMLEKVGDFWGRLLMELSTKLKKGGETRSIRLINGSPQLIGSLVAQGLDGLIPTSANLAAAHQSLGLSSQVGFDVNVVVPFINSTMQAIECLTKIKSGKNQSTYFQDAQAALLGDVSAVISIKCPTFSGLFVISFPKETLFSLVSKLTGAPQTEIDGMVESTAGEFANIAVMSAKKNLNDLGYGIQCTTPSVTQESNLARGLGVANQKCMVVPLDTEFGEYFIDFRFVA